MLSMRCIHTGGVLSACLFFGLHNFAAATWRLLTHATQVHVIPNPPPPPPYQTLRGGNLGRGHKAAFKHVSMPTHTSPITRINACLSACAWTLSDGSRKIQDVTHTHSGQGYSDRSAVLLLNTVAKKTAFKYNVSLFSSGQ